MDKEKVMVDKWFNTVFKKAVNPHEIIRKNCSRRQRWPGHKQILQVTLERVLSDLDSSSLQTNYVTKFSRAKDIKIVLRVD